MTGPPGPPLEPYPGAGGWWAEPAEADGPWDRAVPSHSYDRPAAPAGPVSSARRCTVSPRSALVVLVVLVLAGALASGVVVATRPVRTDTAPLLTFGGNGVTYTSHAGRFRAHFPSQPSEQTLPGSVGGSIVSLHVAVVQDPIAEVASELLSAPVSPGTYQSILQVTLSTIGRGAGAAADIRPPSTFRGWPAREATVESSRGRLDVLAFFYSSYRLYLLVAPDGGSMAGLRGSFAALP